MIKFILLQKEHLSFINDWYIDDPEALNQIEFAIDPSQYWELLQKDKNRFSWVIYLDNTPIGLFDMKKEDNGIGYIAFIIRQEYRGRGLCNEIIETGLYLPEVKALKKIEVYIEKSNFRSLICLEAAGFKEEGEAKDGFIKMVRI